MQALLALHREMSPVRRRQLLLVLAVMLLGGFADLVTIGAVLPFLALLADPGRADQWPRLAEFLAFAGGGPIVGASLLLASAAVVAALVKMWLTWLSERFVMDLGRDISTAMFGRMLRQPYLVHVRRNSSEILSGMEKIRTVIFGILQPGMQGGIAAAIAVLIVALLLLIDAFAVLVAATFVAAAYGGVTLATRRRLSRNSVVIAEASTARTQLVQESLGGIRDILLDRSQPYFEERFALLENQVRQTQSINASIRAMPRFLVESSAIVALVLVTLVINMRPGGLVEAIPVLGALALGAQRLLPLVQQAYTGWASVTGNVQSLLDVLALLDEPAAPPGRAAARAPEAPAFDNEVRFDRVSFRYGDEGDALCGISLVIPKGIRLGIAGATGSGKSTFLDLLMGLLDPKDGEILIDGIPLDGAMREHWQARLAHVPQNIYLADDSVAGNIAFGEAAEAIDMERIEQAARIAHADAFIRALPRGYRTRVGERGSRLSGGERQRIGLARALYRQADVLILDEATSALDTATEAAVLDSIAALGPDLTCILVAHRETALSRCDRIVRLERRIAGAGVYETVIREDPPTGQHVRHG